MNPCPRNPFSLHFFQTAAVVAALLLAAPRAGAVIGALLQAPLGNPTGATADPNNHSHYLIQRAVETIDYNDNQGQPNWASWDLTSSDVGSSGRSDAWAVDTSLPASFNRIPTDTYDSTNGQSYDRGHMCPSADRTDTVADNEQVFIMSNIIPQASAQNQGVWNTFEGYCRTLLTSQELLITCGPYNFGPSRLDSGMVGVASNTFKIVVCVPLGTDTNALRRLTNANPNSIRIIALEITNASAVVNDWTLYITSTKQIQNDTGYNFFSALPNNLAWVLRSKVDGQTPSAPGSITFSPSSGAVGAGVTITGTALDTVTNVAFNGTAASYTITSPTQISAIVPTGATSGAITVRGLGGNATSAASFTVSGAASVDLAITAAHSGNFTQGDTGDTYTITVANQGTVASSGTVTVIDTLPAGLAATAIGGTGWTVDLPTLTCTRSDALAANGSYPPITLTVNVSTGTAASITNSATVSGGGDANSSNNTAKDPTTVIQLLAPTVRTGTATALTTNSATLNGTVNPNNQSTTAGFQYGLTTAYGSMVAVPGTLTGTSAQAASAGITGLAHGTTYHFRITGTNATGTSYGSDQTFATALLPVVDLALTSTHTGSFTQGDIGDTYTIVVTNKGTTASSGTVTVTDALPTGLTAIAISGTGWTPNLPSLTCTRSTALAAGASYPAITVTVNVAANAANLTNTVSVSGGGDTVLTNNTASDPTTIITALPPVATTGTATSVAATSATLNGTVNPKGQPATAQFQYGLTTSYGSTAAVSGNFTGTTTQNASVGVTGLAASSTYHFRLVATNVLGTSTGQDQTFTTPAPPVPDLAITATHVGNFTQSDVGDTYTITVTNVGNGASSGTVTVVDTLPTGLTATALSGTGWSANLSTLTCTRSDALNPGAIYPPITLTVSVSASAPASVTNTVAVSGGSDSNSANNTASNPTTINVSIPSTGPTNVVMSQIYGGGGNSGAYYQNDFVELFNPGPTAVNVSTWSVQYASASGVTWSVTSLSGSIQPYHYYLVQMAAGAYSATALPTPDATGTVSMSATGAKVALVRNQTALSGGNPIGSSGLVDFVGYGSANYYEGTGPAPTAANNTSVLRNNGGYANTTNNANDFTTVTPPTPRNSASPANPPAIPDLAVALSHTGSFTQGDTGQTYTIIITNRGTATTAGTVTVADTLPAGLTATAISGTGWTPNLSTLTCTRSDALAAAASYPAITVTVSVSSSASASVTNAVTVSGGGDTSSGNNTASDPTTIIPLPPIQSWRLQYFGTTANTGPAADTAVASTDGMPNLLKYALGLNPLLAATNPVVGDITTGHLRLTCPKNPNATDITYLVELTSDLTTGPWTTSGTTADQNTSTLLQVHDNTPVAGTASRFIRLHVTHP